MSADAPARTAPDRRPPRLPQLPRRWRVPVVALAVLLVLSVLRTVTGATDLTSSGSVSAAIGLAVPIGMAGLGGLWTERAGVTNIGLEGMMILGTFGAGWIGYQHGPWAGLAAAVLMGALGGLLHAVATITFGVDQIISGVAINILGLGATKFLASLLLSDVEGGGPSQSPRIASIGTVPLGALASPLKSVEGHHVFLVSDLAGVLGGVVGNLSWITVIAVGLLLASAWVLWQTPFGLRLRACGEDPYAAESLGVGVRRHKYAAVVVSGALAGVGGAYLAIVSSGIYREGQTSGRGYIGLAAMIFGNWRPGGLATGAALFGYADALQLRNATAVHALILLLAVGMLAGAVLAVVRRRRIGAGVLLVLGVLLGRWVLTTETVPSQVTFITPHVATLLVLALASQRLRMPAADGDVYRKGGGDR